MTTPALINVAELIDITRATAATTGTVDDPAHLCASRVFLFSGSADTVVHSGVVKKLEQYYRGFGMKDANIKSHYNVSAEHALPTLNYGNPCGVLGNPYLGKCGFDAAGRILTHALGGAGMLLLGAELCTLP